MTQHTCTDCEACEQEKREEKEKKKLLESWNWNATPRQVAREIREKWHYEQDVFEAMREFGFREDDISKVEWELEDEV